MRRSRGEEAEEDEDNEKHKNEEDMKEEDEHRRYCLGQSCILCRRANQYGDFVVGEGEEEEEEEGEEDKEDDAFPKAPKFEHPHDVQ